MMDTMEILRILIITVNAQLNQFQVKSFVELLNN